MNLDLDRSHLLDLNLHRAHSLHHALLQRLSANAQLRRLAHRQSITIASLHRLIDEKRARRSHDRLQLSVLNAAPKRRSRAQPSRTPIAMIAASNRSRAQQSHVLRPRLLILIVAVESRMHHQRAGPMECPSQRLIRANLSS